MSRKTNKSAIVPVAPLSITGNLSLTRAQQDALILAQLNVQKEEAVCKAALASIRSQLDSDISSLSESIRFNTAALTDAKDRLSAALAEWAPSQTQHYVLSMNALIGAGHDSTISTTATINPLDKGCTRYTAAIETTLTIATNLKGYRYGQPDSVSLSKTIGAVPVSDSLQSLLETRDRLSSASVTLSESHQSLRLKRDSLWQLEDDMKARLALKSISQDPDQSAALSDTISFLQSKLGLAPSNQSNQVSSTITPRKRV